MGFRSGVFLSACAAFVFAPPAWAQDDPTMPPLPPAPGDRVRDGTEIHFLAYNGDDAYVVTVGDQSCSTPCTLRLRPGPTKVHVVGAGETDLQVVIPHLTAQVRVHTGPPRWFLPAGAVLVPGGLVVGASMWALGFACGFRAGGCMAVNFVTWPIIGISMLVIGSVLLGIYNRAVPPEANRTEILDARRERGWRFEGLSLGVRRDGVGGLLTFVF